MMTIRNWFSRNQQTNKIYFTLAALMGVLTLIAIYAPWLFLFGLIVGSWYLVNWIVGENTFVAQPTRECKNCVSYITNIAGAGGCDLYREFTIVLNKNHDCEFFKGKK